MRGKTVSSFYTFLSSLLVTIAGLAIGSQAQTLPDLNAFDQNGIQPFASYHGGDIDRIGLSNGTVAIDFPFLSYPQRGSLKLSFSMMYNNQPQHYGKFCVSPDPCVMQWAWPINYNPLPLENGDVFVGWDQSTAVIPKLS